MTTRKDKSLGPWRSWSWYSDGLGPPSAHGITWFSSLVFLIGLPKVKFNSMGQNCIRSAFTRTQQGCHWPLVFFKISHLNTGKNIRIRVEWVFTGLGEQTVRNFCNSACVAFWLFTKIQVRILVTHPYSSIVYLFYLCVEDGH